MPDLFAPPVDAWQRVSPRLRDAHRIGVLAPCLVGGAVAAVAVQIVLGWWWLTAVILVLLITAGCWGWWWTARNQAAWGYAENADDLFVRSGIMVRRLVAVPYGRMQYVDVQAGPLARRLGIATITLHTASPDTAARIPGLPADEATRLRDRLTELGEAHAGGL